MDAVSKLTFGQFLNAFPLPCLDLHFRFRRDDPSCGYAWQDMASHEDIVPMFQGSIFVKILKLGDASAMRRRSRLKLKQHVVNSGKSVVRSAPSVCSTQGSRAHSQGNSASPPQQRSSAGSAGIDTSAPVDSRVADVHSPFSSSPAGNDNFPSQAPEHNMFSGFDEPAAESTGAVGSDSFISAPIPITNKKYTTTNAYIPDDDDIDDGPYNPPEAEAASGVEPVIIDFMDGMSGDSSGGGGAPVESAGKSEALEFKRLIDRKKDKEAEEGDESRKKLQGVVAKWATNNGEKRNVRTLLSTLHTIITWTSWKHLNLGDVMEAKKVKLHYRKAMVIVHPDKNSSFNSDQKYLGQRAFECLNEAYNEFETKESVA